MRSSLTTSAIMDVCVVGIGENFEASLLTATILRKLGVKYLICRAQTAVHAEIFRRIGADEIIQPETQAAEELGRRLSNPHLEDLIQLAEGYSLIEMLAPRSFRGKTLEQIGLRTKYQVNLIGVRRPSVNSQVDSGPGASTSLARRTSSTRGTSLSSSAPTPPSPTSPASDLSTPAPRGDRSFHTKSSFIHIRPLVALHFFTRTTRVLCGSIPPRHPSRSILSTASHRLSFSATNVGAGNPRTISATSTPSRRTPTPRNTGKPSRSAMISRRVRPLGASGQRSGCGVKLEQCRYGPAQIAPVRRVIRLHNEQATRLQRRVRQPQELRRQQRRPISSTR